MLAGFKEIHCLDGFPFLTGTATAQIGLFLRFCIGSAIRLGPGNDMETVNGGFIKSLQFHEQWNSEKTPIQCKINIFRKSLSNGAPIADHLDCMA